MSDIDVPFDATETGFATFSSFTVTHFGLSSLLAGFSWLWTSGGTLDNFFSSVSLAFSARPDLSNFRVWISFSSSFSFSLTSFSSSSSSSSPLDERNLTLGITAGAGRRFLDSERDRDLEDLLCEAFFFDGLSLGFPTLLLLLLEGLESKISLYLSGFLSIGE